MTTPATSMRNAMPFTRLTAMLCALALPGCNDNGPTGPTAHDLDQLYPGASVNLISCAKVNDATYRCRFTFNNPQGIGDYGEHTQCFATDGAKWETKIFGC